MAVLNWRWLSLAIVLVLSSTMGTESFPTINPDKSEEIDFGYGEWSTENKSDRPRERFIPRHGCDLRVYDAEKQADVIREWHDLVKNPIDEESAMRQLIIEACDDDDDKNWKVMCNTYLQARNSGLGCVPGLLRAECVAVTMYTIEGPGFYREYNNASAYGVWEPYKVYTSLLFSAVKKLAAIEPLPLDARLYRGMGVSCNRPNASRIFWKTFTSTSLDPDVAGYFGTSTFYEFQPTATLFGARVANLSQIPGEGEVLIPPFEVFNFEKAEGQKFYFTSSRQQDLLHGHAADNFRSAQTLTTLSAAVISTAIVVLGL